MVKLQFHLVTVLFISRNLNNKSYQEVVAFIINHYHYSTQITINKLRFKLILDLLL